MTLTWENKSYEIIAYNQELKEFIAIVNDDMWGISIDEIESYSKDCKEALWAPFMRKVILDYYKSEVPKQIKFGRFKPNDNITLDPITILILELEQEVK